ncbi:hypothetical protein B7494_g5601 [Chlorociboria aeruginascens]|nr:hypothetical protein B7494_g5601 [Chlorociboria aeruginascens]
MKGGGGLIKSLGRDDDQVNIKGVRVELSGVSTAIEKIPGVEKAYVVFDNDILYGFYSGTSWIDESILRREIEKYQPYYAIPNIWKYRATLPLTANGEVDKQALLDFSEVPPLPIDITIPIPEKAMVWVGQKEMSKEPSLISSQSFSSITTPVKEELMLPDKKGRHGWRAMRHRFFTLYRRFFSVVFLANVTGIILGVIFRRKGTELETLGIATAVNLTVAILIRQDHVINALFKIACSVPKWAPFFIRRNCAKVYHIGGIHSGCAMAATMWLVVSAAFATYMRASAAAQVVNYLILALFLALIASAYPAFRVRLHDKFEVVHRFGGWTVLALFWIETILTADHLRGRTPLRTSLLHNPVIWLLSTVTGSIILPWLRLRKVTIRSEVLSDHAIRLYFDYCTPVPGSSVRLSHAPLTEWHSFACIPKPHEKGFSVLISNAGDWTSGVIRTVPTKIWIRGVPTCGVLNVVSIFKSMVLVATGSGIGPCLSVIYANQVSLRIFWSTPNPETTFGQGIINDILDKDDRAVIHNTKTMGRPDMVAVTYRLFKESGAEAVCIISNQKLTRQVVYGMESRGIPAFGAIWDS